MYPFCFLKKVGNRYGVNIVFTDPNKLGKVSAAVQIKNEQCKEKKPTDVCHVKQTANSNFTDFCMGVVYKIHFSCI